MGRSKDMFMELRENELMVQRVSDGLESPLKAYAMLQDQIKHLTKCSNEIKDKAIEEATKYGEKTFSDFEYEFTYRNGGKTYDYSNIEEIVELEKKIKELKKEAISRTKIQGVIISDDGEVLEKPKVKYSSDSITIKPINNGV